MTSHPARLRLARMRGIEVKGSLSLRAMDNRGVASRRKLRRSTERYASSTESRDDGYFAASLSKRSIPHEYGAQRGAVQTCRRIRGPLTPGVGARKSKGEGVKSAATITKIPVLPISYADALHFSGHLADGGPVSLRGVFPSRSHRTWPGESHLSSVQRGHQSPL